MGMPSLPRLLALRETGREERGRRRWREEVVRSVGRFELPTDGRGGLVWVLGTKHKAAFLRSLLVNRPDAVTNPVSASASGDVGGTVVLDGVVRSLSWARDGFLSGLILRRPPGLTVVVCTDVPLHVTDKVLDAIDATVVLPTRTHHFAPLAYWRYLRRSAEPLAFRRAWEAMLGRGARAGLCMVWERGAGLRCARCLNTRL